MDQTEKIWLGIGGSIAGLGLVLAFTNIMNTYAADTPGGTSTIDYYGDIPKFQGGKKRRKTRRHK